jgi:hypothetical protein
MLSIPETIIRPRNNYTRAFFPYVQSLLSKRIFLAIVPNHLDLLQCYMVKVAQEGKYSS